MIKINSIKQILSKYDWILFSAVMLLLCLGLAAIYSVSLSQPDLNFIYFKRQIMFALIGLVFMLLASGFNYSAYRVYSRVIYIAVLILLVLVLFFGTSIRGTTGWFAIGSFGFQPVELAKIALIIFLAKFFSNRFFQFNQAKHIIVSLAGTMIFAILILLQPDFGSAFVLMSVWFILLMLTKVKIRYIVVMALIVGIVAAAGWFLFLQDFQKDRIMTFVNPDLDPLGSGYNVKQAMIAIGSGNIFGRGLGFGSQSQLKFIPESQTDFVFAVIAEELGLLGVSLMLVLWGIVFYRLIKAAQKARDDFGMFLLLGVVAIFFVHIMINIGMNLGLLPVTGLSLPFISAGGSFLVVSFILIGMAQGVIARR